MSTAANRNPLTVTITDMTDKTKCIRVKKEDATPDCFLYDEVSGQIRPAFHEVYRGRGAEWVLNEMRSGEVLVRQVEVDAGFSTDDVVQLIMSRVCWD